MKEEIRNFFDLHIKNYLPFRDNPLYNHLIEFLINYYYEKLYNEDPEILKKLWKTQTIPYEVLDNILISLGYPAKIISIFTIREKLLILNFLHDLYSYKASIDFIKRLSIFDEEINIYELFIDRNSSGSWILKPYLIYKHPDVTESYFEIPFSEVYASIPSLLFSEEQLEEIYQRDGISLPIKSNILLLDYYDIQNISMLNDFITAVFLKEYYDSSVGIYFSDKYFFTTLWKAYFLWYYILYKYFILDNKLKASSIIFKGKTSQRNYIRMIYDPFKFSQFYIDGDTQYRKVERYSMGELLIEYLPDYKRLKDILDWYKRINSREEFDRFYKEIFLDTNLNSLLKESDITVEKFDNIYFSLDPEICNYVNERINGTLDKKLELFRMLDEVFNSLTIFIERSQNSNLKEYGKKYFLKNLPQIIIPPEETKTYLLLYNFKPYHTELLTRSSLGLIVPSSEKFNRIYVDSESKGFVFELLKASILEFSYEYAIFDIEFPKINNVAIINSFTSIFQLKKEIEKIFEDNETFRTNLNSCSLNLMSDDYIILQ